MAPQKTLTISQQEQMLQQQQSKNTRSNQAGDQKSKQRKRKGKQSITNHDNQSQEVPKSTRQQTNNTIVDKSSENKSNISAMQQVPESPKVTKTLVPAQRSTIKNKQENLVPNQTAKEVPNLVTTIKKQISADEPDEIDAGIELDGSSNSGSSVKDINEDHNKSASVSPIMAQSKAVNYGTVSAERDNEVCPASNDASLCGTDESSIKKSPSSVTTTMQKLAANQQVIDADEQQLQQKLRSKQRKSSLKGSLNTSSATSMNSVNVSSNSIASPQSPALCKICEQHVYQMERIMAEKSIYHKGCFRCYQCKVQLRVDNYSSHEGQVYCKAHHRQLFQPQVKLDNEDDVDIVAKSTSRVVDDYVLKRGRLSELSFSFLRPQPEEIRKRQMIICENEPIELPKDVIRSDTKLDDGIEKLNLNLNNILEKFERGNSCEESQPSSGGIVIEKPSFDIKKTLMAFETNTINPGQNDDDADATKNKPDRRVVRKLTNLNGLFNRQSNSENERSPPAENGQAKPLAIRRSESLMMRLKKYESRINGEQVANDSDDDESRVDFENDGNSVKTIRSVPKKLTSLKNQWENGDISRRNQAQLNGEDETDAVNKSESSDNLNGNSSLVEKNEELLKIRQQLARKKSGESASVRNIYENAIKEAQQQQKPTKLNQSDLSALNGFSAIEIQQQLLQNGTKNSQNSSTPTTPNKDHFHLNLSNKANRLKERFEQGLINNSSVDDSGASDGDEEPAMSKLEQLRREKLEDLSIFTEGEIKAREARSMFQQIDRRLSAASNGSRTSLASNSRTPASISASMTSRIQSKILSSGKTEEIDNGNMLSDNSLATRNH